MRLSAVFRVDASLTIGSGHVMRCLALANALRASGWRSHFLCREHTGHLVETIRRHGHDCSVLPPGDGSSEGGVYGAWLGARQEDDADACRPLLAALRPDWLVVDHYALDARWELALRDCCGGLLAIDDLADRPHDCDLLLDQNLGRDSSAYDALVPAHCRRLTGTHYALLRPEFAAQREASLARRKTAPLRHLLVTMGGVDQGNVTGKVLTVLATTTLHADCRISVIMGPRAPWLAQVRAQAAALPWRSETRVDVDDMAGLLAGSDLVIGAAGSSAWERCCLGVPALHVILAANQEPVAAALAASGASAPLGGPADLAGTLPPALALADNPAWLARASLIARGLCDGLGAQRVVAAMVQHHE